MKNSRLMMHVYRFLDASADIVEHTQKKRDAMKHIEDIIPGGMSAKECMLYRDAYEAGIAAGAPRGTT